LTFSLEVKLLVLILQGHWVIALQATSLMVALF